MTVGRETSDGDLCAKGTLKDRTCQFRIVQAALSSAEWRKYSFEGCLSANPTLRIPRLCPGSIFQFIFAIPSISRQTTRHYTKMHNGEGSVLVEN